ncbi:hypothetical protein MA16_Dca021996 [Dendrobium catenatum]|uniref:Uncharacterized protein n=1 Tax=Dendrobium catenatum TaxID=906689 RepID=A0A2I0X9X7_9ASPA|nr:hypothetical protein MA16_Dca021996 [Dendrobium catenatum]
MDGDAGGDPRVVSRDGDPRAVSRGGKAEAARPGQFAFHPEAATRVAYNMSPRALSLYRAVRRPDQNGPWSLGSSVLLGRYMTIINLPKPLALGILPYTDRPRTIQNCPGLSSPKIIPEISHFQCTDRPGRSQHRPGRSWEENPLQRGTVRERDLTRAGRAAQDLDKLIRAASLLNLTEGRFSFPGLCRDSSQPCWGFPAGALVDFREVFFFSMFPTCIGDCFVFFFFRSFSGGAGIAPNKLSDPDFLGGISHLRSFLEVLAGSSPSSSFPELGTSTFCELPLFGFLTRKSTIWRLRFNSL